MSVESLRKVIRSSEIRKAFGPEAMQLLEKIAQAEFAHGENIELLRTALTEHTLQQIRLSSSLWARLKWIVRGRLSVNVQEVNRLLSASRAAHDMKKRHAGLVDKNGTVTSKPNYPKAEAHIVDALTHRVAAHALDPEHTASGWSDDKAPDADLIKFYLAYSRPYIPEDVMAQVLERFPAYAEIGYIP